MNIGVGQQVMVFITADSGAFYPLVFYPQGERAPLVEYAPYNTNGVIVAPHVSSWLGFNSDKG